MMIGVAIPAYNAARWIETAVRSVLSQTHRDFALVVVDDGSTDGTAEIVATFFDPRVQLIRQANAGVSAARNSGIRALLNADVEALLLLDADDWLAPDALARMAEALVASPDAVAAVGACMFVDRRLTRRPPSGDIVERLLVSNLFANCGQVLVRSEALRAAGEFRLNTALSEDWEFLVRVALQGRFVETASKAPVLFVQGHIGGTVHRLGTDLGNYAASFEAVFGNPTLLSRFGSVRLNALKRRREATNTWAVGGELIRHGRESEGRALLRYSLRLAPSTKRAVKLVAAHVLTLLPGKWRGRLISYSEAAPCVNETGSESLGNPGGSL